MFQLSRTWSFWSENGEAMQILHYEHGQKYEPHFDFFRDKMNQQLGGHRIATVLMYLSNVEKGGETVFPNSEVCNCLWLYYSSMHFSFPRFPILVVVKHPCSSSYLIQIGLFLFCRFLSQGTVTGLNVLEGAMQVFRWTFGVFLFCYESSLHVWMFIYIIKSI